MRKEKIVDNDVLLIKLQEKTKMSLFSKAKNCIKKYSRVLTNMAIYYPCIYYPLVFFEILSKML